MKNKEKYLTNFSEAKRKKAIQKYNRIKPFTLGEQSLASISKSKGIGMTAIEALDLYDSDSLRFHLLANGPEKKDTNFTIEDFENTHNGEILNKFGNLVNRTLRFKDLEELPCGELNEEIRKQIEVTYKEAGELIEKLEDMYSNI